MNVSIDGDKLRAELKKRGLNISVLSQQLGYSKSYLNWAIRNNQLSMPAIKILENDYNLHLDAYVVKDKKEEAVIDENTGGVNYHTLYRVIYGACYQAMKRALSE